MRVSLNSIIYIWFPSSRNQICLRHWLLPSHVFFLFFFFFWINKHYSISLISQRNRIYKQHVTLLFPNLPSTMSHLINWNPNFPMKFGIKFLMFDEISYCILNEICSPRFMHWLWLISFLTPSFFFFFFCGTKSFLFYYYYYYTR